MDNRIRRISVQTIQPSPAQAEVWITVVPERQTAATEVRGRMMGPRCPYASTVEVAYPLRPLSPSQQANEPAGLTRRITIPEASLWEPQCPFLYEGPIELWQDGLLCDRAILRHGLRSVQLKERGLYVNGRPLLLQGREVSACSDEEAMALRRAGCNLLIAALGANTLPLRERADRLGFFLLGRVNNDNDETVRHLELLSGHPSCLGWLIEAADSPPFHVLPRQGLTGLICTAPPNAVALSAAHFLFGAAELANLGKPLLVKGEGSPSSSDGCLFLGNVL
jgi:hypothetical protein